MQVRKILIEIHKGYLQRQSIFDIMDIYVKKNPASKLKFDCIGTCRNIWWKPYFTPERFLINPIWRKIKYDVTKSTPQHEKQKTEKNRIKTLVFTHCFIDMWTDVSVIYFLINPWWLYFLLSLNPYFIIQICRIWKIVCIINLVKYVAHFAYTFTVFVTKC